MRMSEGQAVALIRAIACPVLFIAGAEGFASLQAQWQQRHAAFARIERVILAGNHHFIWKIRQRPRFVSKNFVKFGRIDGFQ